MLSEPYGKLCGTPQQRVIYDTMRYCFREVVITDIGRGFGIGLPAPLLDDFDYLAKDEKPPDVNFLKVHAWLRGNGPAFASDMAKALGVSLDVVLNAIRRNPERFTHDVSLLIAKNGTQRTGKLWRVV